MLTSRSLVLLWLVAGASSFAGAKDKPKILPAQALRAETILVVIEPGAGEPLTDPTANRDARENVEKALMQWGRFRLTIASSDADLILSVRKGSGRATTPIIRGGPIDNQPVILEPNGDSGIRIGAQQGRPPAVTRGQEQTRPSTGTEVGPSEDTVALYLGRGDYPLDSPPIWRYAAKGALDPPKIPALDELRKSINETEKALQQKKKP